VQDVPQVDPQGFDWGWFHPVVVTLADNLTAKPDLVPL
jgi:hypothetical protein